MSRHLDRSSFPSCREGPGYCLKSKPFNLYSILCSHFSSHLNTHDIALDQFDVGEHQFDFSAWRAPITYPGGNRLLLLWPQHFFAP